MTVAYNVSLKPYNTFGIDVKAKQFITVKTLDELEQVLSKNYSKELFILGGGSNMLLTGDIDRTVLHIDLKGKNILSENDEEILIKVSAGENWHKTVLWTLDNNWGGFENLSLIPGNTGTAPIQNIGAYGVEIKDSFVSCDAIDIQTLEKHQFSKEECAFDYRDSIFKSHAKGKYIITSVNFLLKKKNHILHTNYGTIHEALAEKGITSPTIRDVSEAVIKIRQAKLPDPSQIGNSGSFFKNPIISKQLLRELQAENPEVPHYQNSPTSYKIPAGWLIDKAGLKGYRIGDAGVHRNQALVLVNYGSASGKEILQLSRYIQEKIFRQFNIQLQPEVNIF